MGKFIVKIQFSAHRKSLDRVKFLEAEHLHAGIEWDTLINHVHGMISWVVRRDGRKTIWISKTCFTGFERRYSILSARKAFDYALPMRYTGQDIDNRSVNVPANGSNIIGAEADGRLNHFRIKLDPSFEYKFYSSNLMLQLYEILRNSKMSSIFLFEIRKKRNFKNNWKHNCSLLQNFQKSIYVCSNVILYLYIFILSLYNHFPIIIIFNFRKDKHMTIFFSIFY